MRGESKLIDFDVEYYAYPNGNIALKDFKETFQGGEFVIGDTGSGKSTVLRMMNGLIPNFYSGTLRGSVTVDGAEANPRDVFFIAQNPEEMVTCLRVVDEVAFPLVQRGISVAEARREASHVCEMLGIGHLLDRSTTEISTGELQLVEIACSMVADAKYIVMDEPFAHLSERNALRVIKALKSANVIVADHRIEFARYFNRIVDLGLSEVAAEVPEPEVGEILYEGLLELREGEIVAITGDNGAGKTMLLKEVAADMRAKGLRIGVVLQHPPYHLCSNSVGEEVSISTLHEFGLQDLSHRHPQSLSSGEMRRVAIARAFDSADILILDEPTAGQDARFRLKLMQLLRKHSKTAVVATHDTNFAKLCDRVIEL